MVTVSDEALAYIERWRHEAGDPRCLVGIMWMKGEGDNCRGANGEALWQRLPDVGWDVQLYSGADDEPWEMAQDLAPGIRVLVGELPSRPFPGGHIYLQDHALKIRANAA